MPSIPADTVKRVALLGDVHAEDIFLEAALDFVRGLSDIDAVLCTGAVVTGQGDANRCCDLLQNAKVRTVRGNHDRWFIHSPEPYQANLPEATPAESITPVNRTFLATLPLTLSFLTPRGPLLLCHGTGTNDMLAVYPRDGDWVLEANHTLHALYAEEHYGVLVRGHTHARMLRHFDHLTLLNPGTFRRDKSPCFLIVDFTSGQLTTYELAPDGTVTATKDITL